MIAVLSPGRPSCESWIDYIIMIILIEEGQCIAMVSKGPKVNSRCSLSEIIITTAIRVLE